MSAVKVSNFPTGTIIKVGDKFDHLICIGIEYRIEPTTNWRVEIYIFECDCKDCNRNIIKLTKARLKIRPILCCKFIDCKYSPANWITINDQEYSLLPGSIIGNLEIIGRCFIDNSQYGLRVKCTGDCNSLPFEIKKQTLQHRVHLNCGDSSCSSFNNTLENESIYPTWLCIKQRIFNPNNSNFNDYDDLIIGEKMESEWVNDPKAFEIYAKTLSPNKKEMQQLYPNTIISLDRINNSIGIY